MARQAVVPNRVEEELAFASDVTNVDEIELQEIMENTSRSTGNLMEQLEGESSEDLRMRKLLGLDKQQLWRIRGSLKVEVAKKA